MFLIEESSKMFSPKDWAIFLHVRMVAVPVRQVEITFIIAVIIINYFIELSNEKVQYFNVIKYVFYRIYLIYVVEQGV